MSALEVGGRQWVLEDNERPMTMNHYRTLHFHARAKYDKEVRGRFGWLARQARVPKLTAAIVTAVPLCRRGPLPDVGACFPTAKAAIDGLVDVNVLPDDKPAHLLGLTFIAPGLADRDALLLIIEEAA